MCLSSVFEVNGNNEKLISQNVAKIEIKDGDIVITDILGEETTLSGSLKSLDFITNKILVDPK